MIEHPSKIIFPKALSTLTIKASPCTSGTSRNYSHSFSTKSNTQTGHSFEYQSMDFFEEPISFLAEESAKKDSPTESLLVFDTHLVQLLSKGQAANDGGDEFGIPAKAAHSSAITWADLIRHLSFWCKKDPGDTLICDAPMLAVAAFAPMLVQGGKAYLINLDDNYVKGQPSFQAMIQAAINGKDDERLTQREYFHLWCLSYLYRNEHAKALNVLCQLLESCPGDALALSLALDIADQLGDKKTTFRLASSVASYWNERGQGQTSIAGYSIGSSMIAKGLAIGGRLREAEQMADKSLSRDSSIASGVAAAALAHIYHGEGRASEGASTFTGHGVEYYEQCGYLFFNSKMGWAGAGFIVDRDGASADRVAIRLYDEHFARILEYSGYDGNSNSAVIRRIPNSKKNMLIDSASGAATSFFGTIFGGGPKKDDAEQGKNDEQNEEEDVFQDAIIKDSDPRSLEDVLTWLPPTASILVDATFLLFRLTISGALDASDNRWQALQMAWKRILAIENTHSATSENDPSFFSRAPMTRVAMSLVLGNSGECSGNTDLTSKKLEEAARRIGTLMNLKSCSIIGQRESSHEIDKIEWARIVRLLNESRTGWAGEVDATKSLFQPSVQLVNDIEGYDMILGDFIDHSICYAAANSGDYGCLCVARSICSSSVLLQTNSPANWHRYGTILEKLGDKDNANDAFHASVSLGSGEGGRVGN